MFMPRPSDQDHLQRLLLDETPPVELENVDPVSFTYNPLHDLESIWWVATFFIFHHFTIGGHNRRLLDLDVAKLFPTGDDKLRSLALTSERIYTEMIGHLPTEFQMHGKKLDIFRQMLLNAYASAESKADINKAAFIPRLHTAFGTVFNMLRDDVGSHAACVNELKKQSLADEREEVKSFGDIVSSPSAGKGKMMDKQTSTGKRVVDDGSSRENAVPRRSTRLRKVMHEQVMTDDTEHFEHTESSHSTRKQKTRKGQQSK
jgi:hypothetical protein